MLTDLEVRDALPDPGPTTSLDKLICDVLSDNSPREPREIWKELPADVLLSQVHARIRVLRQRGVLIRLVSASNQRGPGAGRYLRA